MNAALVEFFGIADIEAGNIPPNSGNILGDASNTLNNLRNIPATSASNIPADDNIPLDTGNILTKLDNIPVRSASNTPPKVSNIPLKSLVMEVLPGKLKISGYIQT
ncbi:hypothetical protein AVDCRST_MAG84-2113 [uncultured Microcoleus sp.]|uniref:Uncharacterized protein n=1 Tax=uncultured Microcoleus sp. TaxID=259945 RepID=A0A6J4LKP1_9CYAN|nr:hypothetical protein AVDCRST_MAG84-2113 [uncultured Microcoleus sp.]